MDAARKETEKWGVTNFTYNCTSFELDCVCESEHIFTEPK